MQLGEITSTRYPASSMCRIFWVSIKESWTKLPRGSRVCAPDRSVAIQSVWGSLCFVFQSKLNEVPTAFFFGFPATSFPKLSHPKHIYKFSNSSCGRLRFVFPVATKAAQPPTRTSTWPPRLFADNGNDSLHMKSKPIKLPNAPFVCHTLSESKEQRIANE